MVDSRRVNELIKGLSRDDLAAVLQVLPPAALHDLGDALNLRASRTGMKVSLVHNKLRTATAASRPGAVRALGVALVVAAEEVIGDERVAEPSVDDVRQVLPRLVATFGADLTEAVLVQMALDGADGADAITEALSGPWRDEPAGDPVDVAAVLRRREQEAAAAAADVESEQVRRREARRSAPPPRRPDSPPAAESRPSAPDPEGPVATPLPSEPASAPAAPPEPEPGPSLSVEHLDTTHDEPATHDVAALLADDARIAAELDTAPLFSPLDAALLRTVVAALNQELGAPTSAEVVAMVDEVVRLNSSRHASYFHLGFLSALDPRTPEPPAEALNEQRRRWYRFGRLSGLVRQDDREAVVAEVRSHRATCTAVLADPRMGMTLVAPVTTALLADEPDRAADVIEARGPVPFRDVEATAAAVYQRARHLLVERRATSAERLFTCLEVWRDLPGAAVTGTAGQVDLEVDLIRRRSSCRRSVDDFAGAEAVLDTLHGRPLTEREQAMVATERGLVAARIGHLGHVHFPDDADRAVALLERLDPGLPLFEEAVSLNPGAPRASYLLGLAAWCREQHDRAAALLEQAAGRMRGDPLYEETGVASAARFHRAAAHLAMLEEGSDGPDFAAMKAELDAGHRPPLRSAQVAIEALATHRSPHLVHFIREVLHRVPQHGAALAQRLVELCREGNPGSAELLSGIVHRVALGVPQRYELLEAVVRGAGLENDRELVERTAADIDDLLVKGADAELDARWAQMLRSDATLREVLGGWEAELERVEVLRRLGRLDEAAAVVEGLFNRSLAADVHYEPDDLLDLLEEITVDHSHVAALRQRVPDAPKPPEEGDPLLDTLRWSPVKIVFVGGNEKQEAYRDLIDGALRQRYGDRVQVHFEFPGWSANWHVSAERAEAELRDAHALVLMQFVRTNMGRRMRRVSDDHDVPWVPCTGHGRGSMERAIHRAVRVAVERIRSAKGMDDGDAAARP